MSTNQTVKAQWIRGADVVLIGPVMMAGGIKLGGAGGALLALLGVGTVIFNAANYARVARARDS